jgi:disulfide bond formation protein DsbB
MLSRNRQMYLLLAQFAVSVGSIFGSLFFSEVMKYPPCNLCWYQRIFIYPVALIVVSGVFLESKDTNRFLTPFVFIGLLFAVYHNLVYYKFIQILVPCTETAPCTAQQLNFLGFITIPLMSLGAFVALAVLNVIAIKIESKKDVL